MFRQGSILGLLVFLFALYPGYGQEIIPQGYFLSDSIKLGEPVQYSLSVKHPKQMQVLFPDSSYIFVPFEFEKKIFFNTRSDSLFSFDSVVYYLSTFEIDLVQKLSLPIYVIQNGDSTPIFANTDSVFLVETISEIPEPVNLKETSSYREVKKQFNYPYFILGTLCLLLIIILLFSILGKPIKRRFKVYRLEKAHRKFINRYLATKNELQANASPEKAEFLLYFWKEYMEKLEGIPYRKLTTKEILSFEKNENINRELKVIDRNIYGHRSDNHLLESFGKLIEVTKERFEIKKEEVLND